MSGFDENPFGEPTVNDPFADPAVRQATTVTPTARSIDDYNPFADPTTQANAQQVRGASNPPIYGGIGVTQQPATLQPTSQEAPPAYTRTPQQTATPLATPLSPTLEQRTEEEWKARREEEMTNPGYYRRNNWPPLPDKCCFQPCFYQDIEVEIDSNFQKIVKQLYFLWIFHGLVLLLNVIGSIALMFTEKPEISDLGLSILYLILFTPFSFVCWFRPAYKAFKTDSSINFMVFFFVFFFQFVVTTVQAVGFTKLGTCGLYRAIATFDHTTSGTFVGILVLLIAFCYCVAAASDLLLLTKIHRIYRSSTASISKAQQEFTTTFLRNEHVQNAAGNIAASTVRAQMANSTQPRY